MTNYILIGCAIGILAINVKALERIGHVFSYYVASGEELPSNRIAKAARGLLDSDQ